MNIKRSIEQIFLSPQNSYVPLHRRQTVSKHVINKQDDSGLCRCYKGNNAGVMESGYIARFGQVQRGLQDLKAEEKEPGAKGRLGTKREHSKGKGPGARNSSVGLRTRKETSASGVRD